MDLSQHLTLEIVTTGGTIDKSYDETDGTLQNRESQLRAHLLADLRLPNTELVFHELFSKDSLDMTESDRQSITDKVKDLMPRGHPILIIHGTDTMAQSANYVANQVTKPSVPVIFTGAMAPVGFQSSDALQNMTESIVAARLLSAGIYICFHSTVFSTPNVRKNKRERTFEAF